MILRLQSLFFQYTDRAVYAFVYMCKVGWAIKHVELMRPRCQPSNVSLQDLMSEITDDYVG